MHLLAQQKFALAVVDFALGLLADLPRQPQHLDAVGEHLRDPVEPALDIDGLEDLLLLGRGDVHEARDQIGERRGRGDRLHRIDEFGRDLRQQLQHLDRLVAQIEQPRLDVLAGRLDLGHALDPRGQERVAVEKIEDPKAPLALADRVMRAVGARHIAQEARLGAHAVQVDRDRVVGRRVALQQQADRPAEPHRRLRRRDRALAAERDRQYRAGKQDEVARRDQDQRVSGSAGMPANAVSMAPGGGAAALSAVRKSWSSRGMAISLIMAGRRDRRSNLVQLQHQAAICQMPAGDLEPRRRQLDPALEVPMRYLQPVDLGVLGLGAAEGARR